MDGKKKKNIIETRAFEAEWLARMLSKVEKVEKFD